MRKDSKDRLWRRLGIAGLLFFSLKGLLWLAFLTIGTLKGFF